jgi:CRP-like cAMP-binding protein
MIRQHTSTTERRRLLRAEPIFARLTDPTIDRISSLTTEVTVKPGSSLTKQGAPGREAFIILDGEAAVRVDGELRAMVYGGDVVGDVALLRTVPRTADVVALSQLRVLVLNPAELATLWDDWSFREWVLFQLAGRFAPASRGAGVARF